MGDAPLVSVVAICYDHERFLGQCLDSLAAQTHPATELVIVDDCSSDGSVAAIRAWLDRTGTAATFLVHEENQGICRSRNHALEHAHGEYVSFISTDDYWLPAKLAHQLDVLANRPEAGVAYCDALQVDESGAPLPVRVIDAAQRGFVAPPEGDVFEQLLIGMFLPPGPLVRRRCLDDVGPFDESLAYEDWDMYLRLARRFPFAFSPSADVVKRDTPGSLWKTLGARAHASDVRILSKYAGAHPELWPRIAMAAYLSDHPDLRLYLRRSLRQSFSWRHARIYAQAMLGIRHAQAARIKRAVSAGWRGRRPAAAGNGAPTPA